jgi:hypothetical protein
MMTLAAADRTHFVGLDFAGISWPRGSQGDAKHRPETRGVAALLIMTI